jgi:hypothetical protein
MNDSCETEAEYFVSKALMLRFIKSALVEHVFGPANVLKILEFFREHIETQESRFCFYRRRDRRHFDTIMNTAHEGTNNGIKYCAAPVLPTHTLAKSARTLSQNGKISARQRELDYARDIDSTKLWSQLPTSEHLTQMGEGLVVEQWKLHNDYESRRINHDCFQVRHFENQQSRNMVIPIFKRTRTVFIADDGRLRCDCCHFERIGIVCRHMMHVLQLLAVSQEQYLGVTHHDISVFWWSAYAHFA